MPKTICKIDGCNKPVRSRGWCVTHYRRWYRQGDPNKVLDPHACRVYTKTPPIERFMAKVEKTGTCWLWTGYLEQGYGRFQLGGDVGTVAAHRWSYEHHVGPIPDGLHIDHLCRTPACVNPDHLEPVTQRENNIRSLRARFGADKCTRGHDFTPENTYWRPDGAGRQCRKCNRLRRGREVAA